MLPWSKMAPLTFRPAASSLTTMQMTADGAPNPTTFREAEVLGLRLMQEGNFDEALIGTWNYGLEFIAYAQRIRRGCSEILLMTDSDFLSR